VLDEIVATVIPGSASLPTTWDADPGAQA